MAETSGQLPPADDRTGSSGGGSGGSGGLAPSAGGGAGGGYSADRKTSESPGFFHILKPGQGSFVRWGTAVATGIIAVSFASFLSDQMRLVTNLETVQYFVPVVVLAALAIIIFRLIAQNRKVVDFLILTEREMKQVNWSTRREITGHTKVVIFVLLALGFILFVVDVLFIWFFDWIGVLRIGLLERMLGGGGGE